MEDLNAVLARNILPWVPEVLAFNEELSPGVGSRLNVFGRRPKAEDTSGEAARKNLWRRAP